MNRDIQNYLKLRTALVSEKAKLEARLNAINKVLGGEVAVAVVSTAKRGGRRTFSAATKAKMAAAQKARWAAKKKGVAVAATPATSSAPAPKKKRTMSAAGKANIRAAVKARWAKVEAAKAKAGK